MSTLNRAGLPPAVEGAFASYNPRFIVESGPGALVADAAGVATARCAWANLFTGIVSSARQNPTDTLGFVYVTRRYWPRTYWDSTRCAWVSRQGFPLTLARRGDFWARFAGGSYVAQAVYANVLDGSLLAVNRNAGPVVGYELTPWQTVTEADPGSLAIISTWSFFTP